MSPFIIATDGKLYHKSDYFVISLRNIIKKMGQRKLTTSKIIMNKDDYDDIVKWSQDE